MGVCIMVHDGQSTPVADGTEFITAWVPADTVDGKKKS